MSIHFKRLIDAALRARILVPEGRDRPFVLVIAGTRVKAARRENILRRYRWRIVKRATKALMEGG